MRTRAVVDMRHPTLTVLMRRLQLDLHSAAYVLQQHQPA
jgi:hypothetical protein